MSLEIHNIFFQCKICNSFINIRKTINIIITAYKFIFLLTYIFINLIRTPNFVKQFYIESRKIQPKSTKFSKKLLCPIPLPWFFVANFRGSLYFKFLSSFAGQRRSRRKSGQVIIAPPRSVRAGEPNGDNIPKQRSRKGLSFLSTESHE